LQTPVDFILDTAGNLVIAEADGPFIRKLSPDGILTLVAGKSGVYSGADGPAESALFQHPNSVSFDSAGNLFIADEFGPTIRKLDTNGFVTTVGGLYQQSGSSDGIDAESRFAYPRRVLATPKGVLYVVDTLNHTIRQGIPVPVISATLVGGQLTLTWTQSTLDFGLETAASVSAGSVWAPVTGATTLVGDQWIYTESTSSGPRYFRLRRP
jgi:hypothetical protein